MEPITEAWTGEFCHALEADDRKRIATVLGELVLTSSDVEQIMAVFVEQMDLANSAKEAERKKSDLLMENTHIRQLMDGTENGEYLGLDLGGTNFRVVLTKFTSGVAETNMENYTIPSDVLCGPVKGVFDFIAEKIHDFFNKYNLERQVPLPLGFVFSFPSKQIALNSSILVTWTKSFKCPDGVGMDPVKLLEEALDRHELGNKIDVVAVLSDTTGTLLAGNYLDKLARIGVILGTGCNAAFVENLDKIDRWTGDKKEPKHVIINVEWGAAGDNGCLDFYRTQYEKAVDLSSNHVGSFTFEKSFSGLYLGELVRLVLVRLASEGLVFGGNLPPSISQPWSFPTSYVTQIESDKGSDDSKTLEVLEQMGLAPSTVSKSDVAVIREVTALMSRRGAYIIASAIAALVNRTQLPKVTVAIDGSLYECHPKFHDHMMNILLTFCPNSQVKLTLVKDGTGLGAAFAAESALRQNLAGLRCS